MSQKIIRFEQVVLLDDTIDQQIKNYFYISVGTIKQILRVVSFLKISLQKLIFGKSQRPQCRRKEIFR